MAIFVIKIPISMIVNGDIKNSGWQIKEKFKLFLRDFSLAKV